MQVDDVDNKARAVETNKLKHKLQWGRQRRMLRRRITTGLEVAHNEYYSCTGGIDGSLPTQEDDPYTPTEVVDVHNNADPDVPTDASSVHNNADSDAPMDLTDIFDEVEPGW